MPAMTALWRERFTITGYILLGVGALGLLIWALLPERVVVRRLEKQVSIVAIVQLAPPPRPPPKNIRPLIAKDPPTAAPRPQQTPSQPKAQPAPKSPMPAQRKALAMDAPLDLDPFEIPPGTAEGDGI